MGDIDSSQKPFCVDRPTQGRATCRRCDQKCLKGELRLAKYVQGPRGPLKYWYHIDCLFEVFLNQRPNTRRLVSANDLDGWNNLSTADKELIIEKVEQCEREYARRQGKEFESIEFEDEGINEFRNTTTSQIIVMKPIQPMLAEACKNMRQALKKFPNGIFSEVKYDGERVQVHKKNKELKFFSRSLLPVQKHKIVGFDKHISKAMPNAKDVILDCEVVMVDKNNGKPLPFGTLGKNKQKEQKNASLCLFIFDCMYLNGEDLTERPLKERRDLLSRNMTEIPNVMMLSEMKEIYNANDLAQHMKEVIKLGLEGLVLKDILGKYEPGERHWLKVKKDHLYDGKMADTSDLVVLGSWGKSVFLMGVYDANTEKYYTVTKVRSNLKNNGNLVKNNKQITPKWLNCSKTMLPEFIAKDPKQQPVWEVIGAEFIQTHRVHTANGISIRFPRVKKVRTDKNWKTATSLDELTKLYNTSKYNFDGSLIDEELEILNREGKFDRKRKAQNEINDDPRKRPSTSSKP
ncbi:PREDICTED: DNA ligase 3-like [Nicrophorus vespilloides]|uniref:DNA ligase n=1 Tax=Nicrophorus vespilloides TaxID=110193 RepID=A0ABM1MNZ3_NICVS|nr:PREDICTED: DNA ligase 3-like [Nicrophorus vespilloides]